MNRRPAKRHRIPIPDIEDFGFVDIGDVRFARDVERLHASGPLAVYRVLSSLGRSRLIMRPIEQAVHEEISV